MNHGRVALVALHAVLKEKPCLLDPFLDDADVYAVLWRLVFEKHALGQVGGAFLVPSTKASG